MDVWAKALPNGASQFIGAASYGSARPDVGAAFGTQFTNSAYTRLVSGLPPGRYRFTVYAHSTITHSFNQAVPFDIEVDPVVAAPVFNPPPGTYASEMYISAASVTAQSVVRYTTNGSDPTTASPVLPSNYYISGTTTIKAKAYRTGWTPSPTATGTYVLQVGMPLASPGGGIYDVGQDVTLSAVSPFDLIRYTTDGTPVTPASPVYFYPITITDPTTIRARAFRPPFSESVELVQNYVPRVTTPIMSPAAGQYPTMPLVSIVSPMPEASIRYTTDRTDPTTASALYTGALAPQAFMTIRARAFRTGWAPSAVVVGTYWDLTPPSTSVVIATLAGASPSTPASVGGTVQFQIGNGTISTNPIEVFVYRNGVRLPASATTLSSSGVTLPGVLVDGENRLELEAPDQEGLLVYEARTIWAGNRTLTVTARRRNGTALAGAAAVARLARAGTVSVSGTTNAAGQVALSSLPPSHEVRLVVTAVGFRPREVDVAADATSVTVDFDEETLGFEALTGWTVAAARAGLSTHSEISTPLVPCSDCLPHAQTVAIQQAAITSAAVAGDLDLVVDTKNLFGPQTVSRTITVAPGTSQVTARFRFQSDELWWALPGRSPFAHYDDWFTIRLRPVARPAAEVTLTRTISQLLGQAQFDANAATPWYSLALATLEGEAVEVTFTVANAIDNGHLSILFADVVQETIHRVAAVELRDLIDSTDPYQQYREDRVLTSMSLSPMPSSLVSYGGYIKVHGTLRIEGPSVETLTNVWLEVWDNGQKVATAPLARTSESNVRTQLLNVPFGSDGTLEVPELSTGIAPVLFEFLASDLTMVNQLTDTNNLLLQVHATRLNGSEVQPLSIRQAFNKMTVYPTGTTGRFGSSRDLGNCAGLTVTSRTEAQYRRNNPPFPCGGDSWALPSTVAWAQSARSFTHQGTAMEILWNDFSNMHGGLFAGHSGHRAGDTIDGTFAGYTDLGQREAEILLSWVGAHASRIARIYVGFSTSNQCKSAAPIGASNAFYNAIVGKTLSDGRAATAVILNQANHCDHFDVRLKSPTP